MQKLSLVSAAALIWSVAVSTSAAAPPALVNCTAIDQVYVVNPRDARYFFLDLPPNAKLTSMEYMARNSLGEKWGTCNGGAAICSKLTFAQDSATEPFPDKVDGTPHYFTQVTGVDSGGLFEQRYVRMVLNYQMPGPTCIVQHTYYVARNSAIGQLTDLRIPAGKTVTKEYVYGRVDPVEPLNTGPNWISCGPAGQGAALDSGMISYNACLVPIAVGMQTSKLVVDGIDFAPGRTSNCGANGHTGFGYCRIALEYTP